MPRHPTRAKGPRLSRLPNTLPWLGTSARQTGKPNPAHRKPWPWAQEAPSEKNCEACCRRTGPHRPQPTGAATPSTGPQRPQLSAAGGRLNVTRPRTARNALVSLPLRGSFFPSRGGLLSRLSGNPPDSIPLRCMGATWERPGCYTSHLLSPRGGASPPASVSLLLLFKATVPLTVTNGQ